MVVVTSVGVLYLVLANLLFSRTYDMLTASMEARGESNVGRLKELVSWGLAAESQKEVLHALETFKSENGDARSIIVLDAKRQLFAKVGKDDPSRLISDFGTVDSVSSRVKEGYLVAVAPIRPEGLDQTVGYVIYCESAQGYLDYRQNMMIIALLASVLGLIIVGKLLHSQISVSMDNAKLCEDLEQSNEELSTALMQAKISARVKNEFLANTSHELRTPLNAIINIPEWFLDASFKEAEGAVCLGCDGRFELEGDEKVERDTECPVCGGMGTLRGEPYLVYVGDPLQAYESLSKVVKAGKHLLGVVNDLLDMSTLEIGKMDIYPEEVCIKDVFEHVQSIMDNLAAKKNITLQFENVSEGQSVFADQVKLSQILINLIGNAVKFSEVDTAIEIGAKEENDGVLLTVKDYGIGIEKEEQEYIFEAFRQAKGGLTRSYGGTGLGLAVTKKLVELHDGKIWVESEVGKGSTFFVTLPDRSFNRPRISLTQFSKPPDDAVSEEKIMVVDDDITVLETSVLALDRLGYDIRITKDATTVIEKIEEWNPKLVILDLMMPKISGLQILRQIRQKDNLKNQPVLVSSAYYSNRDIVAELGAYWIAKPWSNKELSEKVKEIIEDQPV